MSWENRTVKPQYNIALAFEIGLGVPDIKYLKTLSGDEYLETIKSNDYDILLDVALAMEKVEGVELSVTAWYKEGKWSNTVLSVHDNYLLSGHQGPRMHENCITMFSGKNPIKKIFKKLGKEMAERSPDYDGIVTIDITYDSQDRAFYRKIKLGQSLDFFVCWSNLHDMEIEELIARIGEGKELEPANKFSATTRLYSYPYDPEDNYKVVEQSEQLFTRGSETYIASGTSNRIDKTWKSIYKQLKDIERFGVCYRTDGDVQARRTFHSLKQRHII